MNQTTISIRIDSNDKKSFENFCDKTGMNISTAINMFIKTVLREQRLPFEIKTSSFDEEVYKKLLEAEIEMKTTNKRYTSEEAYESMLKAIHDEL